MDKVKNIGKTDHSTRVNGKTMPNADTERSLEQTQESMWVNGKTISCMDMENSNGLMVKSTQDIMFKI